MTTLTGGKLMSHDYLYVFHTEQIERARPLDPFIGRFGVALARMTPGIYKNSTLALFDDPWDAVAAGRAMAKRRLVECLVLPSVEKKLHETMMASIQELLTPVPQEEVNRLAAIDEANQALGPTVEWFKKGKSFEEGTSQ
jgi:hypothetical protein